MRWAELVEHMNSKKCIFRLKIIYGKDNFGDIALVERIIFKWIVEKYLLIIIKIGIN